MTLRNAALTATSSTTAAWADLRNEHIRKCIEGSLVAFHELCDVACHEFFVFSTALRGGGSDGHWSAIHVHLTIAHFVEPSPSESRSASREGCRDRERIGIWIDSGCISIIIARDALSWTTALDRVDDPEFAARSWSFIIRDGELTGASSMYGAPDEGDGLR
jgi:hypothetical protein